jgi:hypothetical protein
MNCGGTQKKAGGRGQKRRGQKIGEKNKRYFRNHKPDPLLLTPRNKQDKSVFTQLERKPDPPF